MFQEGCDFPVVFEETDDRLVQPGERFVAVVFPRIVNGAAVEHESSTVACRVFGDAFFIGKTADPHDEAAFLQVGELLQLRQLLQELVEVRILRIGLLQELAQVLDGIGHALHEVGFLLEITAKAVAT